LVRPNVPLQVTDPIVQLGATSFVNGGFGLQFYLPYLIVTNGDTVAHALTFELKSLAGAAALPVTVILAVGETEPYPVAPFQSVSIDTATANVVSFYSAAPIQSYATVKVQGNQTVIDYESGSTNMASGSGMPVKLTTGSIAVPIGSLVTYTLGVSGFLAAATAQVYIQLVGNTTGEIYAQCTGPASIWGSFYPYETEKIDVYTANNDAANHYMAYTYQATSP
jgi:hypothetical protein